MLIESSSTLTNKDIYLAKYIYIYIDIYMYSIRFDICKQQLRSFLCDFISLIKQEALSMSILISYKLTVAMHICTKTTLHMESQCTIKTHYHYMEC